MSVFSQPSQLSQWRQQIIDGILNVAVFLGAFAATFALVDSVLKGDYASVAFIVVVYVTLLILRYVSGLAYNVRAGGLLVLLYALGVYNLVLFGKGSDAFVFFLSLSPLAVLLFGLPFALISVAVTTLTLLGFALAYLTEALPAPTPVALDVTSWATSTPVFIFISLLLVVPTNYLLGKLADALAHSMALTHDLQVINRTLRTLSAVNQSLIHAADEDEFLHDICRVMHTVGDYAQVWLGYADADGQMSRMTCAVADGEAILPAPNCAAAPEHDPCAMALHTGKAVVVHVGDGDDSFAEWKAGAVQSGIAAAVAIPMMERDATVGIVTIYSARAESFRDETELKLLRELAGDIVYGIGALRTRQAKARADAAIAQERAYLATLIDVLPFPVLVLSKTREVIYQNHAYTRFIAEEGIPEWSEMEILDPLHHLPVPLEERPVTRALRGETIQAEEEILLRPDGVEMPIMVHSAPIILDGEIVGTVVAGQDISDLKAADIAKNQFLMVISHELKTPLTTIIGWAQMAEHDDELCRKAVPVILRNAQEQRRTLERLLVMSYLLTGSLVLKRLPLDLRSVLEGILADFQERADADGVTLQVEMSASPLLVCGDQQYLRQALLEVLDNALKFSSAGDTITVRAEASAATVAVAVCDTGRGIAAAEVVRLLRPFTQIEREERKGGMGIGLAIAAGVVEAHEGTLSIDSEGPGRGATVTITLPRYGEGVAE